MARQVGQLEAQLHTAQAALVEADCARACATSALAPVFGSLDEAIEALLPYHVFLDAGDLDGETLELLHDQERGQAAAAGAADDQSTAMDADDLPEVDIIQEPGRQAPFEAASAPGTEASTSAPATARGQSYLVASRGDVWRAQLAAKSAEVCNFLVKLQRRVDVLEKEPLASNQLTELILQSCAVGDALEAVHRAQAQAKAAAAGALASEEAAREAAQAAAGGARAAEKAAQAIPGSAAAPGTSGAPAGETAAAAQPKSATLPAPQARQPAAAKAAAAPLGQGLKPAPTTIKLPVSALDKQKQLAAVAARIKLLGKR